MTRASAAVGAAEGAGTDGGAGYLARSARPLASLVFLLPFILIYELGTRLWLTDAVQGTQHIIAFTLMQRFFSLLGATGGYLPAAAVVSILFCWHLAQRDGWTVQLSTLLGMTVESLALGIPLIVAGYGIARLFPLAATPESNLGHTVVLSFGAGIYEELVFRMILCTSLSMLLKNVLKINVRLSTLLLVVLSATLFSAYHYLGSEVFMWRIFVFRMLAGIYFAGVFLVRGFGVTAGSHMAYDVLIVML